jgi:Flp pilus assembly protein TadG
MVEFALAMPILLMLILGVLDVGRGVLAAATLEHAVREGARAGVTVYPASGWDTQVSDRVRSSAFLLEVAALTISVDTETPSEGTFVKVSSEYGFRPIAPYLTVVRSEIPLSSTVRMLVP